MDPAVLLKPRLSGLRSAIKWLYDHGVPVSQLASLFGTNANHIRQLVYRARHTPFRLYAPGDNLKSLLDQPADNLRTLLGIRDSEQAHAVVLSPRRLSRILDLEHQVDDIATHAPSFETGIRQLRQLLPYIGHPAEVHWLRLSARIHQQLAWFFTHSGFSASAFDEAKVAMNLSRSAFADWHDPLDLRSLTETCLIASNTCLLIGDPENALKYLQIGKDASAAISDPRGSEHYRQLGVAYFQMHEDDIARGCFQTAPEAMESKAEAENEAHLLMTGKRHLALLGGNWEESQDILAVVERDYAVGSLQHAMMINSVAASGLMTGSGEIEQHARELLDHNYELARSYYGQWTRTGLLALTPELPRDIRLPWVRRALYENAYKET